MTEPTDSEILDAADDFRSQYMHGGITFDEFDSISFARAVLAKWGTPPAVAGEPVACEYAEHKGDVALLEVRADSVLEDAARYLFLRDGKWRDTDLEPVIRLQLNSLWDAKIDAARKQGGA